MASVSSLARAVSPKRDVQPSPSTGAGLRDDVLAPIIAGAFARGVAETFTLLGLPAFFLDQDGLVLFATEAAAARAKDGLAVRSGHLLAVTRSDNRNLARFIEAALRDAAARPSVALKAAGLSLQALPVPGTEPSAVQMLHAIVVVQGPDVPSP